MLIPFFIIPIIIFYVSKLFYTTFSQWSVFFVQYDLVLSAYSMLELPSSEARDFTVNSLFFVFVQYDLVVSAYSMLELPSSEARIAEINSLWSRYS